MQHYCYYWNETRGDMFDHWGTLRWYLEGRNDGLVHRQIKVYQSGSILAYNEHHHTDIYGMLTDQSFEGSDTEIANGY